MIFWKMMVLYADYMPHLHSQEHPKVVESCNGKKPWQRNHGCHWWSQWLAAWDDGDSLENPKLEQGSYPCQFQQDNSMVHKALPKIMIMVSSGRKREDERNDGPIETHNFPFAMSLHFTAMLNYQRVLQICKSLRPNHFKNLWSPSHSIHHPPNVSEIPRLCSAVVSSSRIRNCYILGYELSSLGMLTNQIVHRTQKWWIVMVGWW